MAVVTNQNKKIATTASGLNEQTITPLDICKRADMSDPQPFHNNAVLSEAAEHTSDRTLFAGGNVIRIGDAVGGAAGEKSHPAHPPHIMRGKGGPYRQEARATNGAPNVWCEDERPARKMDPTTQNKENCPGRVVDPGNAAELAQMEQDVLKRCSLREDEITCLHPAHKSAAESTRAIEVVSSPPDPEELTFVAKRTNAVEPGPADCQHGEGSEHTHWIIHRVPGGGLEERREEKKGIDRIVLDASWLNGETPDWTAQTNTDGIVTPRPTAPNAPAPFEPATNRDIDRRAQEIHRENRGLNPRNVPLGGARDAARAEEAQRAAANQQAQQQYQQDQATYQRDSRRRTARSLINGAAYLGEQAFNLRNFLKIFYWRRDPVRINVQSQACTGALSTEVLVFPAEEADFKFGQAEYELAQAVFRPIEAFAALMSRIADGLGFGRVTVELFKEPEIQVTCRWKELTRDAPRAGLKKYQCNRLMRVNLQIKKIIGLNLEFRFPIARLLDFIPGAGWIVDKAVSYFGIDASCGLGITLDIGMGLRFGVDEYYEIEAGGNVLMMFKFEFYLYIRIRFRSAFHAEGRAVVSWTPTFSGPYFSPEEIVYAKLDRGDVRCGFTCTLHVSVLWWERDFGGEYFPDSWRYVYQEQPLNIFRPVLAMLGR